MFPNDRPQTLGEEIANSISHGLGAAGALAGTPLLIAAAARQGDAAFIAGAAVFAASIIFRSIDQSICAAVPLGTHFVWHTLNGLVLYLLLRGALLSPRKVVR